MKRIPRQQVRGGHQALRGRRPIRLQRRPVLLAEQVTRGIGDIVQQTGIVYASESRNARSRGESSEAKVRYRKVRGIVRSEQRARRRVAFGVPPAPVVHDPHRVGVRLRVHPVDDQHAPVVLPEERRVARKGGIGDVAGIAHLVALRPVVDDRLARGVRLGVAEARGVPAPVRLHEHEELAAVVSGMDDRQSKARGRRAGACQQAEEQVASSHRAALYRYT